MNANNTKSTDIDRQFSDYKDDTQQGWDIIHLLILSCIMGVLLGTGIIIAFGRNGFFDSI